jgi:hypothetical protein
MFPARSAHAAGPVHAQLDAEKRPVYAFAVEFQTLAAALSPKGSPCCAIKSVRACRSRSTSRKAPASVPGRTEPLLRHRTRKCE